MIYVKIENILCLLFILSWVVFSCSSRKEKIKMPEIIETEMPSSTHLVKKDNKFHKAIEQNQDSLRRVLIKAKPNKNLKNSILMELYIRGLVNEVDDMITFNLHGLDCGAPDSYSTDISFEIRLNEPVAFPKYLKFKLFEHGCVSRESLKNEEFILIEKSMGHINYFSKELKSNLIIKKNGELYYYPHQEENSVSVREIDEKFENYAFEDAEVVPYQSTFMTSQFGDYGLFIKNE